MVRNVCVACVGIYVCIEFIDTIIIYLVYQPHAKECEKKIHDECGKICTHAKRPFPPSRTAIMNLFSKTKWNKITYSCIHVVFDMYTTKYYNFFNNDKQTILICHCNIVCA